MIRQNYFNTRQQLHSDCNIITNVFLNIPSYLAFLRLSAKRIFEVGRVHIKCKLHKLSLEAKMNPCEKLNSHPDGLN